MSVFEWTAVIGAAAWVPQIVGWVALHFAKPKIRLIPSRTPEIGYTSLGPIFNLTCALAADRKDGVVERMTAAVTHERGHSISFVWNFLNETFSQVRSADGIAEVSKNQPAIALKVSTLVLTEKQIGMQEGTFDEEWRVRMNALIDRRGHLRRTDPENFVDLTLRSKELDELVVFARNRFPWQEGTYTLNVDLQIVGVKKPTKQTFHFCLSSNEVERLRQNLEGIERYVKDLIEPPAAGVLPNYRWNWAYPPFDRSDRMVTSGKSTSQSRVR